MSTVAYIDKNFQASTLRVIERANVIIEEMQEEGFDALTLRQLYYQFVSKAWIENTLQSYKRLGSIVADGRMCGLIDWTAIEDRGRELVEWRDDVSPTHALRDLADHYSIDMWRDQPYHVEVWVEKEALIGVLQQAAGRYGIPVLACKGYMSLSEMWVAANRFHEVGKPVVILHFGDHDPSGIDMTRDIEDRLWTFGADRVDVRRLALNMDQVEEYNPPPNPAKTTDSRSTGYIDRYGRQSWELDALHPSVFRELVTDAWEGLVDRDQWREDAERRKSERVTMGALADRWDDVVEYLGEDDG